MAFKQVRLGDYFKFEKGLGYKGEFLADESDVALIGMDSHEEGGGYKEGSEKPYSGPFKEINTANPGEVIFAATDLTQDGRVLGSPLLVPESEEYQTYIYSHHLLKAIQIKEGFLPEYLYNLYRCEKYRMKAAYADSGTTVRALPAEVLEEQLVPLPDLSTQLAINEIISLIDQQIANNKAISRNLEALAQSLFKSWFIDFDPVHAKKNGEKPFGMDAETAKLFPDSFVKSELGDIPKGWTIRPLGELIENFDGKRKPMSGRVRATRRGKYPYYGATGIVDYVDDFLFQGAYILVGEDGSVMTAKGTPVLQYVWGDFWVNNHAHVIRPKSELNIDHLYLILNNINISEYITGAVQLKLNQLNLNSIQVLVAPSEINSKFGELVSDIYSTYKLLQDSSLSCNGLLSTLIPNVVSGELTVPPELIAS